MRGHLYTPEEKKRAGEYVVAGKSYNEIYRLLGIPKSTACTWFGKTLKKPVDRPTMLAHLSRIRKLSRVALKNKREKRAEERAKLVEERVEKEIVNCPLNDISFCKSLLAMLYWAEGDKYEGVTRTKIANTDPSLLLLYITLLRKCYDLDERKLKVNLYLHYYHPIRKTKLFWSRLLNIPLNQFLKTFLKKRSKTKRFRKNFRGICFVCYPDSQIGKELIRLGKRLQENVTANAPIVQWTEHLVADQKPAGPSPAGGTSSSK